MASIVITTNQDLEDITLGANNIPGAELPKPPELCTIAIIKRWLSCRGAQVSGKRHELMKSVNDYFNRKIEIEKETKEQHKTRLWFDVRRSRITASKSKRCLIKPTTSPTKAICEVLQYNKPVKAKAMQDGIESERHFIKEFERKYDLKVVASCFVVSESHPFLGASPDGMIDNETIVEVKKIHLKAGESHKESMCRLGIYTQNGSELQIIKNHAYFHQIQQQMFYTQ